MMKRILARSFDLGFDGPAGLPNSPDDVAAPTPFSPLPGFISPVPGAVSFPGFAAADLTVLTPPSFTQPATAPVTLRPERATVVRDAETATTATKASLAVGGAYAGTIDTRGDVDWLKLSLTKGKSYTLATADTDGGAGTINGVDIVGLYDAKGRLVAGTTTGATDVIGERITVTAAATGTYYLAVAGQAGATGSYTAFAALRETTAPTLTKITPADETTSVAANANLTLTFSETVRAGTGFLRLAGSDGSSRAIDMSDRGQVTVTGTTVTVNPASDLTAGIRYTVTLDKDAVRDYSGNAYAGLASSTAANFTVKAAATATPTPTPTDTSWNVMVYVAGDNNLESYGIADINEMESVLGLPGNVKISVLFDRAAGYSTASGNWTDTRAGIVSYDGSNLTNTTLSSSATSWGELDTGAGATLTRFLNWSATTYSAANTALIVWNHGGGIYGSAWDDASGGDYLSLGELSSAIAASTLKSVDVVGFDACLMQMTETTTSLASVADYVVGSQDYVPGNGMAYDRLLKTFVSDANVTTTEFATAMVDTYTATYAGYSGIQMSAVATAAMSKLSKDISAFVDRALALSKTGTDWTALRGAAAKATEFGADAGFNFGDLAGFVSGYVAAGQDALLKGIGAEILADVQTAVVKTGGSVAGASGLAVYLPNGSDAITSGYATTSFAQTTDWDDFLAYL